MARKVLTKKEVTKQLANLLEWKANPKGTQISKTFPQPDFLTGVFFIGQIAVYAEVAGHHPDIELTYDKVKVKLTTHDAEGVTSADVKLARRIDGLERH